MTLDVARTFTLYGPLTRNARKSTSTSDHGPTLGNASDFQNTHTHTLRHPMPPHAAPFLSYSFPPSNSIIYLCGNELLLYIHAERCYFINLKLFSQFLGVSTRTAALCYNLRLYLSKNYQQQFEFPPFSNIYGEYIRENTFSFLCYLYSDITKQNENRYL